MSSLSEVGDDIHVITTENWRLNSGLVVGSSRALVIDTGAGPRQGREILEAVRSRDADRAAELTRAHLQGIRDAIATSAPADPQDADGGEQR